VVPQSFPDLSLYVFFFAMNVSGLTSSDRFVFASTLFKLLTDGTASSLPLIALSVDVYSTEQFVNGILVKKPHSFITQSLSSDFLALKYSVEVTLAAEASRCLDLLLNVSQAAVDRKDLDQRLSFQLKKTVLVLSFQQITSDPSEPGFPSPTPKKKKRGPIVYMTIAAVIFLVVLLSLSVAYRRYRRQMMEERYDAQRPEMRDIEREDQMQEEARNTNTAHSFPDNRIEC
jgi:hypothetical protein